MCYILTNSCLSFYVYVTVIIGKYLLMNETYTIECHNSYYI